ncbi:Hypothetical protein D9617_2g059120 [Elsinoe fawcettii]|nr:Hypothetical protein D9617_2g059120 [Elsinoe fawcettii]
MSSSQTGSKPGVTEKPFVAGPSQWENHSLYKLYQTGLFSDCKIKCKTYTFNGHICVLASACAYFEKTFCGNFKEGQDKTIDLSADTPDAVKVMIKCAYGCPQETAFSRITPLSAAKTYIMADRICYTGLKRAAGDHLLKWATSGSMHEVGLIKLFTVLDQNTTPGDDMLRTIGKAVVAGNIGLIRKMDNAALHVPDSDCKIVCGSVTFEGHVCILAGACAHFEKAFCGNFKEAKDELLDLSDDDPVCLRALIKLAYGCPSENIFDPHHDNSKVLAGLYVLSDRMGYDKLEEIAAKWLQDAFEHAEEDLAVFHESLSALRYDGLEGDVLLNRYFHHYTGRNAGLLHEVPRAALNDLVYAASRRDSFDDWLRCGLSYARDE